MGRRKTYDRNETLRQITDVFWSKGYHATSIADLEQATGLDRGSLAREFGGKEAMFTAVLEHYTQVKAMPEGAVLMKLPLGPQNIRRFFRGIRYDEPVERGCLMALTLLERESVPAPAYETARALYAGIEQAFAANLQPLVRERRLPRAAAGALATYLVLSLYGIIVAGRAGMGNADLRRAVKVILTALPQESD